MLGRVAEAPPQVDQRAQDVLGDARGVAAGGPGHGHPACAQSHQVEVVETDADAADDPQVRSGGQGIRVDAGLVADDPGGGAGEGGAKGRPIAVQVRRVDDRVRGVGVDPLTDEDVRHEAGPP